MQVKKENNKIHFNYQNRAYVIASLNDDFITIEVIRVESHFRRLGIASMLMEELLKYINSFYKNIKKIILNPLPLDPDAAKLAHLINFYKKFGFVLINSKDQATPYLMAKYL